MSKKHESQDPALNDATCSFVKDLLDTSVSLGSGSTALLSVLRDMSKSKVCGPVIATNSIGWFCSLRQVLGNPEATLRTRLTCVDVVKNLFQGSGVGVGNLSSAEMAEVVSGLFSVVSDTLWKRRFNGPPRAVGEEENEEKKPREVYTPVKTTFAFKHNCEFDAEGSVLSVTGAGLSVAMMECGFTSGKILWKVNHLCL